jgi:mRNA-degrading endonuclease RelE of RelBE toxin-antitoxin system
MIFIETPVFSKLVEDWLPHDSYVDLQHALLLRPDTGPVIPGSGGLRKVRWGIEQQGKRGGLRVIYYWDKPDEIIYMLFIYRKSEREDLTPGQIKALRRLIKEYLE